MRITLTRIFVSADLHFGHANILKFTDQKGELIRGKVFKDIEEHDEMVIKWHNEIVKPEDHWYCLGDVVINKKSLRHIVRLNGHKRLVMGNHDIFKAEDYLNAGFEKLCAARVWPKHNLVFSHIPLHPDSLKSRGWTNIHGHTHSNIILDQNGYPDSRYRCVSLEQINYRPILLMN